jgi:3-oxoacyl-[acyl-carrier protein] reductase
MDLLLQGRVAAVAAASSGLGKAAALELAKEGAKIAICSRDEARVKQAAQDIANATGGEVFPVVADVSTRTGCKRFIAETARHYGGLDIPVTNAGGPPAGPAEQMTDEQWLLAIDLNLLSTIRMVYAALPHLRASDQGRVIAITSISAKQPLDNLILSNTTRAGVLGFIKSMANELGHTGITFNAILPGWTRTARVRELLATLSETRHVPVAEVEASIAAAIPVGRMGSVEEFAATVAFLASGRSGYIDGLAIQVDGGQSKSVI